ncbi:MAG: efflux RND transporter periplasmic adaptor subunit [Gammaproteobacteria bacterium]|nr:efflux RND transporter periplasmic adaptor subunit [Gammaproteobacteria bacterium]
MKKKTVVITAGVVAIAAVLAGLAWRTRGEKPMEVRTTDASLQQIVERINATGKIQPRTQVKISADVSARIMRLGVREGDRVEAGQFLVELDREAYLAAVESSQANVRSAESGVTLAHENMLQAERELRRAREIVARGLDSQARLDAADAGFKVESARYEAARGDAARARAALKQSRDSLAKTSIFAPMGGVVTELRRKQGEIAIGSQFQEDVILVISDLSVMEAQLDVDENDIVRITLSDTAEVDVDAMPERKLSGKVYEIASSAKLPAGGAQAAQSQNQKTEFLVKVAVDEPPPELRPGMTAAADIITETRPKALSVPIQCVTVRTLEQLKEDTGKDTDSGSDSSGSAFTADEDGFVQIVFVLQDGKALARQVTTGIQSDRLIEVTSGLQAGETVISGSYRAISRDLHHGGAVRVNNERKDTDKDTDAEQT